MYCECRVHSTLHGVIIIFKTQRSLIFIYILLFFEMHERKTVVVCSQWRLFLFSLMLCILRVWQMNCILYCSDAHKAYHNNGDQRERITNNNIVMNMERIFWNILMYLVKCQRQKFPFAKFSFVWLAFSIFLKSFLLLITVDSTSTTANKLYCVYCISLRGENPYADDSLGYGSQSHKMYVQKQ